MKRMIRTIGVMALIATNIVFAADIPQERVTRPEGTEPFQGDRAELVVKGEALWSDKGLSSKGNKACVSCHKGNTKAFKKTFMEAYPHMVKMPKKRSDLNEVDAEQMVQFCLLAATGADDVLPWDSEELAALTAYMVDVVQKQYIDSQTKK